MNVLLVTQWISVSCGFLGLFIGVGAWISVLALSIALARRAHGHDGMWRCAVDG